MAINWFPGHMHKARKEIREIMPQIDLIIEVLDARIPFSSENPLANSLRGDKPCIKVLNKSDLADPELTEQWVAYLEKSKGVKAIPTTSEQPGQIKNLLDLCRQMLPEKADSELLIRALIMGIPNVGKSTIINTLAGRVIAKVGNEPAVTKRQQKINLQNGIVLSDTPGFLWPKLEPESCGYRLAVTGAVKDTAIEYEDVASYAAEFLLNAYPQAVKERYQLDTLPASDFELMEAIGRKRGCLGSGGRINLHKVSEIILNELRDGTLGRLTLETPEMVEKEQIALAAEKEAKKAAKEARKNKRKG
ncbi:ribosome biogenesis GTPase YlqF [Alkalimarinus coralli]|uniref:ribosome biogenesis GTPase YlqF n=1 Tax=Alkalimarinus coralli TaxID=2935863 RepID=UPI00202B47A1|nr:ribosome biogenesis GTPase YlqF [Alkalimarinus coralli]